MGVKGGYFSRKKVTERAREKANLEAEQRELIKMNRKQDKELPPPGGRIKNFNLGG